MERNVDNFQTMLIVTYYKYVFRLVDCCSSCVTLCYAAEFKELQIIIDEPCKKVVAGIVMTPTRYYSKHCRVTTIIYS